MRPRARRFFRELGEFIVDIVQTIRERRAAKRGELETPPVVPEYGYPPDIPASRQRRADGS